MILRLIIILSILGLAEYYSLIVVRSALKSLPSMWRVSLTGLYLLLTVITWLGFIFFRQINWASMPHLLRNIYISFVLGFVVGKILVLLIMLVDDIRRLVTWLITSLAYGGKAVDDAQPGGGIERSEFLKRTALVLGGLSLLGFT
jgi:hypothetical protein